MLLSAVDLPPGWLKGGEAAELARLATGRIVLEVGSWKGRSTVAMARTARHVVAVDHFRGDAGTGEQDTLAEFCGNLVRWDVAERVSFHVGDFRRVLPMLDLSRFDLVFLDAEHTYEATLDAILLTWLRMRAGATIALHDCDEAYPGVVAAACRAFGEDPFRQVVSLRIFEK